MSKTGQQAADHLVHMLQQDVRGGHCTADEAEQEIIRELQDADDSIGALTDLHTRGYGYPGEPDEVFFREYRNALMRHVNPQEVTA